MERNVPLKRTGWPKGKSARRLAPRSAKAEKYADELAAITPRVMERAGYRCEVKLPGCWLNPQEKPHHRKRRSQGGPNTMDNLLAACTFCHGYIHGNTGWSYEHGLLIHRDDPIESYAGANR